MLPAVPSPPVSREARFAAFVAEHRRRAVGLAWRLCGDPVLAEDLAQEAFAQAWRGLDGFRDEASISTWFTRVLVRQVSRRYRWLRVRQALRWTPAEPESRPPGDPGLRARIAAALDLLSPGQREAFVLVHLEGWTQAEVAEATGRAPGTVKSHLHRALVRLREALGDLGEDT